ncbi:MAG: DUF1330 domain-containing protein [Bauldia sp.]
MAKGYWVVRVDVSNADEYAKYAMGNPAIFAKFGGRFLARGGKHAVVEGTGRARNVLIEFPDFETALACFNSAEYKANMKLRAGHATADIVVVEGT